MRLPYRPSFFTATMPNRNISSAAFADTKPHYPLLDGLRGVAALMVVWFHIFEAFATSHLDQRINHGYLAVDFFFILSGFVIGYAYDDRWGKMSVLEFLKRRLIRLHPMVVLGAIIGAVMFYTQGCEVWDVMKISVGALLFATLINALMIPATISGEVRGVGEMYPLNGPSWSLLFEYIGNILYALFIRRLSTRMLSLLVCVMGCGLAWYAIGGPLGDLCVGFSMDKINIVGGSLRLLFAFPAGLLLCRIFKPVKVRGAFWIGSVAIIALASVPRLGGSEGLWINGVYDTLCCLVVFPMLVYLAASGKTTDKISGVVCKFLGDISYPLYMVHYPFIYLYYAWVKNHDLTFAESFWGAMLLFVGSILLAYICMKLYDEPIRKYLSRKLLRK